MSVPFLFTSGHTFGARFLRGLMTSKAARERAILPAMVLATHPRHACDIAGYEDLRFLCEEFHVPVLHFDRIGDAVVRRTAEELAHHYHFVVGLSQMIPDELLQMPGRHSGDARPYSARHGAVGAHPTLLPEGRGRAPIPWTILRGKRDSGVTAFFMQGDPDAGPIIDREAFAIADGSSASWLFNRAADAHEALAARIAPKIACRAVEFREQDHGAATFWEKRSRQHSWIDFGETAEEIERLVRAVSPPYPPAFFVYRATIVNVLAATAVMNSERAACPGEILALLPDGALEIAARRGVLRITEYACTPGATMLRTGSVVSNSSERRRGAPDAASGTGEPPSA